ncbi:protein of unknown function [Mesonia phycicola]|uniref:DUF4271 domain-containing protein n=1 Tax=Mesonia phycicola TaxID=579105 RepID=A0A1M6GXJ7_9FLAO|nr:DUF4271 domain-containing protein [Mesonia phycicola]SHJ14708.1 protein of unknown function [Mesonia phycicola]
MEAVARSFSSNDWMTIVLMAILLLLAFTKKKFSEDFLDFSRVLVSNKYFTSHKRTISVLNLFSFFLFVAQGLIISLGIFYFIKLTSFITIKNEPYLFYIQILLGYNVLIGAKYLIEKIIGEVFEISKLLDNYIFYKITYRNLVAIIISPLLLVLIYGWPNSSFLIYIFLSIWLLANIGILFKYYSQNQKLVFGHWFYFILYLCTLEIIPYIILYKVVTRT